MLWLEFLPFMNPVWFSLIMYGKTSSRSASIKFKILI